MVENVYRNNKLQFILCCFCSFFVAYIDSLHMLSDCKSSEKPLIICKYIAFIGK